MDACSADVHVLNRIFPCPLLAIGAKDCLIVVRLVLRVGSNHRGSDI